MFLETSALTGENVEEAFVQCARKILNKIESGGNCDPPLPNPQTQILPYPDRIYKADPDPALCPFPHLCLYNSLQITFIYINS